MQDNRQNVNDLTTNEGGGGDTPPEIGPEFRSMATSPLGSAAPLAMFSTFSESGAKRNPEGAKSPSTNGKWVFSKAKELPLFPLDKAVVEHISSHIVAARVCDSLCRRSVHAEYDGSRALCITSSYLTYSIDLYDDGEGNCLIEIIRIDGCGFAFRREREAIMSAAQGFGGVPPSSLPTMMKMPEEMLKAFKPPSDREHQDTLMRASDQLHSNKVAVQQFVLRNLAAITSPDKVNQESAIKISNLIMDNTSDMRTLLVSILGAFIQEDSDRNVQLINACLTTFSNVLSQLSDMNILRNLLLNDQSDFIDVFIPHLIKIVSSCKCPHNACLALRCLFLLCQNSDIAQDILNEEYQNKKYVKDAEQLGKQKHSRLQQEAQALLAVLG